MFLFKKLIPRFGINFEKNGIQIFIYISMYPWEKISDNPLNSKIHNFIFIKDLENKSKSLISNEE